MRQASRTENDFIPSGIQFISHYIRRLPFLLEPTFNRSYRDFSYVRLTLNDHRLRYYDAIVSMSRCCNAILKF